VLDEVVRDANEDPHTSAATDGDSEVASKGTEIEVKLRVADIGALRRKLAKLRAKPLPRMFEENVLYDTPSSEFRDSGRLLRIRLETPRPLHSTGARRSATRSKRQSHAESRGILTYKAPPSPSIESASARRYKERQENEIEFRPAANLEAILAGLGLAPGFRYEKYRTSYRLDTIPGLHLDLDETPLGNYLELEGTPSAIDRAAHLLGFAPEDYITGTYWDLYVADCRGRNITPTNLVFRQRKK
jgi:adenylate cyclase, class 2